MNSHGARLTAPKLEAFTTGTRVVWSQHLPPAPNAPELERVGYEWPLWCRQMRCVHPVDDVSADAPPLLGWRRDGDLEFFTIALPGSFAADTPAAPRNTMPEFLRASRGAVEVMAIEATPGVLEVVLSYFQLPDHLGFDPAKIPADPHVVYVGQLMEGSDMFWNLLDEPHGVVAGQIGSGKTKGADLILAQLHAKGWGHRIITPKRREPLFMHYADRPRHEVITGVTDDDLEAVLELFRAERVERWERQEIRADHGVDWWHQVPDADREGRPHSLFTVDESKSYFWPDRSEPQARQKVKAEITSLWSERAQEGRSDGQHCLALTQSPYVDTLGGGFAMGQIGFWLCVRKLDRKWLATVFPDTTSEAPKRVLLNPATPPGRGVARGVATPDNAFGAVAVNDAPVQVAYLDDDHRQALLDGTITTLPTPAIESSNQDDPGPAPDLSPPASQPTPPGINMPAVVGGLALAVLWALVAVVTGLLVTLLVAALGLAVTAVGAGMSRHSIAVALVPVAAVGLPWLAVSLVGVGS